MPGHARGVARRGLLRAGAAALISRPLPFLAGAEPAEARSAPAGPVFASDVRLPGLLHAVIARPPLPGWRLAGLDTDAALAVAGIVDAILLEPWSEAGLGRLGGVAILARDAWSARRGCDALRPAWEAPSSPVALAAGEPGRFVPETAEALMEPPCATASAEPHRCTIWACLRTFEPQRNRLAGLLGLEPDAVTLHRTSAACGPGRVSDPTYAVDAALLSRAMGGAPVSLTWTRADDAPFRSRSTPPASASAPGS